MDALKSRILIADPDPDVSRTLKIYFEANGHDVTSTQFASDILKAARQWQPNAILISTQLADKDPYIICRDILEDTLTAHIPVIMLLHLNQRQARLDALEVGADSFITKPFDIEELRLRVESAIRFSTVWTPA